MVKFLLSRVVSVSTTLPPREARSHAPLRLLSVTWPSDHDDPLAQTHTTPKFPQIHCFSRVQMTTQNITCQIVADIQNMSILLQPLAEHHPKEPCFHLIWPFGEWTQSHTRLFQDWSKLVDLIVSGTVWCQLKKNLLPNNSMVHKEIKHYHSIYTCTHTWELWQN